MLKKAMMLLKKVFGINNTKLLPQMSAEGVGSINVSNFSLVSSNTPDIHENKARPVKDTIEEYIGKDIISYVFDKDDEVADGSDEEIEFTYDIHKVDDMNKKIDYYKTHTDDLYSLPLNEILEMNFYYRIRVENLEKKNN